MLNKDQARLKATSAYHMRLAAAAIAAGGFVHRFGSAAEASEALFAQEFLDDDPKAKLVRVLLEPRDATSIESKYYSAAARFVTDEGEFLVMSAEGFPVLVFVDETLEKLDATFVGSVVSNGTLRTEDLFAAYREFLTDHAPRGWEAIRKNVLRDEGVDLDGDRPVDRLTLETIIDEDLFEALNEIAPEGTHFGAHEYDGACFGFWSIEENDAETRAIIADAQARVRDA